jgi:hypothetical protein
MSGKVIVIFSGCFSLTLIRKLAPVRIFMSTSQKMLICIKQNGSLSGNFN